MALGTIPGEPHDGPFVVNVRGDYKQEIGPVKKKPADFYVILRLAPRGYPDQTEIYGWD